VSSSSSPNDYVGFGTHNTVDLVSDGPGDTTIRPMSPEDVRRALAEWERIERLRKEAGLPPSPRPGQG
jgi:hypothetical protein